MVINNPNTQKALQNSIRAAVKALGGENLFTDAYAKLCIEMELNQYLPEKIDAILPWVEAEYNGQSRKLFRRLGMKEEQHRLNVDFVAATLPALIGAMPVDTKLAFINSQFDCLGVHAVCKTEAQTTKDLNARKLSTFKETGEALTVISMLTATSSSAERAAVAKEGSEAIAAMQEIVNEASHG